MSNQAQIDILGPDTPSTVTVTVPGPQGPTGSTGPRGLQGPIGITGASAYDVAVAEGFEGTEAQWLASLAEEANGIAMAYADAAEESATSASSSAATAATQAGIAATQASLATTKANEAVGSAQAAAASATAANSSAQGIVNRWGEVPVGSRSIGVPGAIGFGMADPALDVAQVDAVLARIRNAPTLVNPTLLYPGVPALGSWGLRLASSGGVYWAAVDRFGLLPVGSEDIGAPGGFGFGTCDPLFTENQLTWLSNVLLRAITNRATVLEASVLDLQQKMAILYDAYLREVALRTTGVTIGTAGAINFGVGPAITTGTPVGIGEQDYYPVHANSDSFM